MAGRKAYSQTGTTLNNEEFVKEKIRKYMADNIDQMLSDIDELPVKERARERGKLLDYIMPKVQAVRKTDAKQMTTSEILLQQLSGDDDE